MAETKLKKDDLHYQGNFVYIVTGFDAQERPVSKRLGLAKDEKMLVREYKEKEAEKAKEILEKAGVTSEEALAKLKEEAKAEARKEVLAEIEAEKKAEAAKTKSENKRAQA